MEALLMPGQTGFVFHNDNTSPPKENSVFSLFSLKGKTAIVTGAGAGIGFAAVETFAEAGANIALWYNSNFDAVKKAAQISEKYGVICRAYQVNVTDEDSVIEAVDKAVRHLNGRLDIFVANAGIPWLDGNIIDSKTDVFRNINDIDYYSIYYSAKAAGQHFRRQKLQGTTINGNKLENYNYGSFVVTSSMSGLRQLLPQCATPYGAAKAAVTHFSRGLAVEWVNFARVNIISPGYINTEMLSVAPDALRLPWKGKTPMGREGTAAELKGAYLYLASDASSYTTGAEIVIDGGYTLV
ncbi:hypothetical protein H072_3760 [Dactylellina haptotyla CBS 200.50]|uniref:Sorbose reductase SOU1 n=1 Tax=Dactylellina haptotyla (strain CBS 200.50) TaxID=1284197 RepID=S8AGW9_DACHA|nr:hypothetical protein H072_3760 [Dactylellina haptotyla CBS 200.50]